MIEKTGHDISRYYGDTLPVNSLGPSDGRNRAKLAADYTQAAFALCAFAKGKPWAARMNVMIAVLKLRQLARHDNPAERECAMRALARIAS